MLWRMASGAASPATDHALVGELDRLVRRARHHGAASLTPAELARLLRLYRHAATVVARLETSGSDPAGADRARRAAARAHGLLFRDLERPEQGLVRRALAFFLGECPRAVRAEWRVLALAFGLLYGFALLAGALVAQDLELAYSLFDAQMIDQEIAQLVATADGEPFRGNFTFGLGDSPGTAGWIMAHNMGVGVLFFASGLVPPLFLMLLLVNGFMLGTYTAVAWHFDQAGAISSILWCHGTLELQAIVLAGAAGLVLVRAWAAPGPWTRRHALRLEAARAWRLLAPVFPLLFVAGTIEGFVSPHAPFGVRIATAVGTGALLLGWALLCGRTEGAGSASETARATRVEPARE
jgi:uncharacterized membrane protein SpoIIM required for sporulation